MMTVYKFSEEAIDLAKASLIQHDKQYLKFVKAVLAIDGEGNPRIEVTQNGFQHRLTLVDYNPAIDDLVSYLRAALLQLNCIIRNKSYLVPSTALGFKAED